MSRKRAERMAQRERAVGLEPDDEAAAWLAENAPGPEPPRPKAASKSKLLHQFRKRR